MEKLRGGQRRHWAEIARVEAWYLEIKRRCDWSDYKLDYEFAWTEEGVRSGRSPDSRPRTFEWIRKESRKPRGLDSRWRGMADLVDAVDRDPLLSGTKALYEGQIWDLLQNMSPTLDDVKTRLDSLLEHNQLTRLRKELIPAKGEHLLTQDSLSFFNGCLRKSLSRLDELSGIALVWLLYLQAEPSHHAPIRASLESFADEFLDHFFADYLPDNHGYYYQASIDVLMRTKLAFSTSVGSEYGYIERTGNWPVIPKDLVGTVTREHLMPRIWVISSFE